MDAKEIENRLKKRQIRKTKKQLQMQRRQTERDVTMMLIAKSDRWNKGLRK